LVLLYNLLYIKKIKTNKNCTTGRQIYDVDQNNQHK